MRLFPAGIAFLAWASATPAQRAGGQWTVEFRMQGIHEDWGVGSTVAGPGDLDFDGYPDLLVGIPSSWINNRTVVQAYSGADGTKLWERMGSDDHHLDFDGAGDLNGDGRPDVIVGEAYRYSSSNWGEVTALLHDGSEWWSLTGNSGLGTSVAGIGDLDLDGFDDVLVGDSRASPGGRPSAGSAYLYSGKDGTLLFQMDGALANDGFGHAVGAAGDLDRDGIPDLLVGAPWADGGGLVDTGAVYVYSGSDGTRVRELIGSASEFLGWRVSNAGDLDGDGYPDLLTSSVEAGHVGPSSGSVYAYSGASGALLYRLDGLGPDDEFGWAIAGLGDLDLDGVPDFAAGAREPYPHGLGRVTIHSGAGGTLLDLIPGLAWAFGSALANPGDVDGDGFSDLLVGAPYFRTSYEGAGAAFLYRYQPFLYAGATALSVSAGVPIPVDLVFPPNEAFRSYALLFSESGTGPTTLGGIQVPLGAGPLLNRMLSGWSPPNVQGAFGVLDANGAARAAVAGHPALAAYLGRTFHMAAVSYDPAALQGRRSSIAWPLRVIP